MSQPAPPSRRGAAAATRGRLFEAGRVAFADKGLAGANLKDDILAPAGVSVGSFYHQFKDKTELLLAILETQAEAFRQRLRAAHAPAPGRGIEEIARASYGLVFDVADESLDAMRIQIRERDSQDPRVRAFLHEDRQRWVESLAADYDRIAHSAGARLDSHMAATLVVGLSLSTVAHYFEVTRDASPAARQAMRQELIEALVRFTLGGISGLTAPVEP